MVKGPGHEMNIFLKGKIRVNVNVGGFWYNIRGSLADFCKYFKFKNRRFSRASEDSYWKDFWNYSRK